MQFFSLRNFSFDVFAGGDFSWCRCSCLAQTVFLGLSGPQDRWRWTQFCVLHLSLGCCCLEGCNWLPPFFFSDLPALQVLHGPAAKMSHGASVGLGGVAGGSVGINFKFFAYPCLRQRPPTPEKNAERARKKDIEKIKAQLHAIWCGKLSRIFYVEFLT